MDRIDKLLRDRPTFHQAETEIARPFRRDESYASPWLFERMASQTLVCYGIEEEVAHFLRNHVKPSDQTLETGAGISTLIFALQGARHLAITPSQPEVAAIQAYASANDIACDNVRFIVKPSDQVLPGLAANNLDLVFLDGKHAFPWPIIDWFYSADRLRKGGLMVVDDAQMRSVRVVVEFMLADPSWSLVQDFAGKTYAFRKERQDIHDVAWHMQPYNIDVRTQSRRSRAKAKVRRMLAALSGVFGLDRA